MDGIKIFFKVVMDSRTILSVAHSRRSGNLHEEQRMGAGKLSEFLALALTVPDQDIWDENEMRANVESPCLGCFSTFEPPRWVESYCVVRTTM